MRKPKPSPFKNVFFFNPFDKRGDLLDLMTLSIGVKETRWGKEDILFFVIRFRRVAETGVAHWVNVVWSLARSLLTSWVTPVLHYHTSGMKAYLHLYFQRVGYLNCGSYLFRPPESATLPCTIACLFLLLVHSCKHCERRCLSIRVFSEHCTGVFKMYQNTAIRLVFSQPII